MSDQISKKGALEVTATLDRLANLFQSEASALGVPSRVAKDFALRCDMLSDHLERRAGLKRKALTEDDPVKESGFDPEEIGAEVGGPLEAIDSDEPFMKGEFTQQENRELRERVSDGDLGPDTNPEPQAPSAGKQAKALHRQLLAAKVAGVSPRLVKALTLATRIAEEEAEKETEEKAEDEVEEKPAAKKASNHGFNLNA